MGGDDYEEIAKRFATATSGLSPREVAKASGLDHTSVRDILEEVRTGQFARERQAGTLRKMKGFIEKHPLKPEGVGAMLQRLAGEIAKQPESSDWAALLAEEIRANREWTQAAAAYARAAEKRIEAIARVREATSAVEGVDPDDADFLDRGDQASPGEGGRAG